MYNNGGLIPRGPSGGNYTSRRWIVVKDQALKDELAALYRRSAAPLQAMREQIAAGGGAKPAGWSSSAHLVEHLAEAPALVIAAIWGEHDGGGRPGLFDSVIQAGWSFQLALRSRGLGSAWTTMLNNNVDEVAELLKIPTGVTTIVTFPVAYTIGTDFKPAARRSATEITYFDRWGFTRDLPSEDDTDRIVWGPGIVAETDVAVSDPLTPDCDRAAGELGDLAPDGGRVTYVCTTEALAADLLNEATVTATGDLGPVSDSDSALVVVLTDLVITKTPELQQLEAGETAAFDVPGIPGATYQLQVGTGQGASNWRRMLQNVLA